MDLASVVPASLASPLHLAPFDGIALTPTRVGDPGVVRSIARPFPDLDARLASWRERGITVATPGPALYVHEYSSSGLTVRGLVGALDLRHRAAPGESGAVLPHELIHPEQARELALRMAHVEVNPAPILLSIQAPDEYRQVLDRTCAAEPFSAYTDRIGQQHRLWAVTDPTDIECLTAILATRTSMIADGHHRYAAYLSLQAEHPGTDWDHGLAMVVDQLDTPFFLGPIHRTIEGVSLYDVERAAAAVGARTRRTHRQQAVDALPHGQIALTDGDMWLTLAPAQEGLLLVNWLHENVLPAIGHGTVRYHHTYDEAITEATASRVAAILPAPTYAAVADLVRHGHLLPEKATSFQPKPSLGVLMRAVRSS